VKNARHFKQAKVWMVANGQFMVDILVLAAQVLPASSCSSKKMAGELRSSFVST